MNLDEFRQAAHVTADWMADYLRDLGERRVVSSVAPGEVRRRLPVSPPQDGVPFDRIRTDLDQIILPGMTHWGHPGFFGYFPANHSPPSILAEMFVAAMGAQCMSWQTSPAATELEQVVMEWLRQMLGLPEGFTGVIQDYASTATLVALITARDQLAAPVDRATVYVSPESHSSVAKGARLAGFRPDLIRAVPIDDRYAMRADALREMIAADRAQGLVPAAIVATLGTTSSTAFDPLAAIGPIAREAGAWLHVDAAFAGSAAIVPEFKWILEGIDQADSLVFNPHKWLFVNHDCSVYFVRDPGRLIRSFGASAEYLKTQYDSSVVNYRDWGVPLGRRFRALKLWFVIRSYGVAGLQALIREHVRLGHLFAGWIDADPDFVLAAPAPVGLVCFRWAPRAGGRSGEELDHANRLLLERINAPGDLFLTHTALSGRFVIRLALGHESTTEAVVRHVWARICDAARDPA